MALPAHRFRGASSIQFPLAETPNPLCSKLGKVLSGLDQSACNESTVDYLGSVDTLIRISLWYRTHRATPPALIFAGSEARSSATWRHTL